MTYNCFQGFDESFLSFLAPPGTFSFGSTSCTPLRPAVMAEISGWAILSQVSLILVYSLGARPFLSCSKWRHVGCVNSSQWQWTCHLSASSAYSLKSSVFLYFCFGLFNVVLGCRPATLPKLQVWLLFHSFHPWASLLVLFLLVSAVPVLS